MNNQPDVKDFRDHAEINDYKASVQDLIELGYELMDLYKWARQVEEEMNKTAEERHEEMSTKHAFPVWARFQSLGWRVVGYVERSQIPSSDEEEEELHSLAWDLIEQSERYQGYRVIDWTV